MVARRDASGATVLLPLPVEPPVHRNLVRGLAGAVRRITDDRVELDLVDRGNLVDLGIDVDGARGVGEELSLRPFRRMEQHVMDVELRPRACGVLVEEEQADCGLRGRERVDVPALKLRLDDLTVSVRRRVSLRRVELRQALVKDFEEVPGAHARVEDPRIPLKSEP